MVKTQVSLSKKQTEAIDKLRTTLKTTVPPDTIVSSTNGSGGEQYEGQVDVKNRRHGTGALKWANGNYYLGQWESGAMKGHGTFLYAAEDDRYEGEFSEDKKDGTGRYTFANGNFYIGFFSNDKRHGKGKYSWVCGDMYDGDWFEGRMQGQGTTIYSNGNKYVGEFLADRRTGQGTLQCTDGLCYSGEWLKNQRHGKGTLKFASGDFYEGEWEADKKHGRGIDSFENGNRFEGNYTENVKTGFGTMVYNNGDRYEGEWQDDRMHGQGEYHFSNGFRYKGGWHDDLRHGRGTYVFPTGHIYEGEWANDKREGTGILTLAPNGEEYRGRWVEGKMDGKFKVNRRYLPATEPLKEFTAPAAAQGQPAPYTLRQDLLVREAYNGTWRRGQPNGEGCYYFYKTPTAAPPVSLSGTWNLEEATKKSDGTLEFMPQEQLHLYLSVLQIALEEDSSDTGVFAEPIDGLFTPIPPVQSTSSSDVAAGDRLLAESYSTELVSSLKAAAQLNIAGQLAEYADWLLDLQRTTLAQHKELNSSAVSQQSLEKDRTVCQDLTAKVEALNLQLEMLQAEAKDTETQVGLQQSGIATLRQSHTSLRSQVEKLKSAKAETEKQHNAQGQLLEKLEAVRLKHQNLLSEQELSTFEKKKLKEEVETKTQLRNSLQNQLEELKATTKAKDSDLKDAQQKLTSQGTNYRNKLKDITSTKKGSEESVGKLQQDIQSLQSFIQATNGELQQLEATTSGIPVKELEEEKDDLLQTLQSLKDTLAQHRADADNNASNLQVAEEQQRQYEKQLSRSQVEHGLVDEELVALTDSMCRTKAELDQLRQNHQAKEAEVAALQKIYDPMLNKLQMDLENKQQEQQQQQQERLSAEAPNTPPQLERASSAVGKLRGLRKNNSQSSSSSFFPGESEALVEMRRRVATAVANRNHEKDQTAELQRCLMAAEEEVKKLAKQEKTSKKALGDVLEGKQVPLVSGGSSTSTFTMDAGREVMVHQLIKARSKSEQLAKEKVKLLAQADQLEEDIDKASHAMDHEREDTIGSIIASLRPEDWRLKYLVEQLEAKAKTLQELEIEAMPISHLEEQLSAVNDQIAVLAKASSESVALREGGARMNSASSFNR